VAIDALLEDKPRLKARRVTSQAMLGRAIGATIPPMLIWPRCARTRLTRRPTVNQASWFSNRGAGR
jgi:hypothetical protein